MEAQVPIIIMVAEDRCHMYLQNKVSPCFLLFSRLDRIELKQLETDKKLEEVFNYLATNTEVKQNIVFDGQIYDAFSFIVGLV